MIISVDPFGSKLELSHCVVAIVEPSSLASLRARLELIRDLRVVVTTAQTWGGSRELRYRGNAVRVDREVRRVEIACREHDVRAVVNALQAVTKADVGRVLAFDSAENASDAEIPAASGLATGC